MANERAQQLIDLVKEHRRKFWQEIYPAKTREERIVYWLASTHESMRTQGETVDDEYSAFSKVWYETSKGHEPDLDALFAEAMKRIGFDFEWQEYRKRIKE